MMKKDIPLDQAVALVRACQKLNCDTADELFAMVERRCTEAKDAKDDALRLHKDKMAYFDAALVLVHSETIKNVCGWYPEIEVFRKLLGKASDRKM